MVAEALKWLDIDVILSQNMHKRKEDTYKEVLAFVERIDSINKTTLPISHDFFQQE
jgi:hypothetical protein